MTWWGSIPQDCTEAQWWAGLKWYPGDELWMQTMDRWAYSSSVNIFCLSVIICNVGTYLLGFSEAEYNRTACHLGLSAFIRCRSNGCLLALKASVDPHFRLHLSFSAWDVYQLDLFQTFILKSLENYRGLPRCYGESSPSPAPRGPLSPNCSTMSQAETRSWHSLHTYVWSLHVTCVDYVVSNTIKIWNHKVFPSPFVGNLLLPPNVSFFKINLVGV